MIKNSQAKSILSFNYFFDHALRKLYNSFYKHEYWPLFNEKYIFEHLQPQDIVIQSTGNLVFLWRWMKVASGLKKHRYSKHILQWLWSFWNITMRDGGKGTTDVLEHRIFYYTPDYWGKKGIILLEKNFLFMFYNSDIYSLPLGMYHTKYTG